MMIPRRRVFAVICSNGLGHFRRSIGLLARLVERVPAAEIEVVCEGWQLDRKRGFAPLRRLEEAGVRWHTGIMSPGVEWHGRGDRFDDGRLHAWYDRLIAIDRLTSADLVLSDNLVGVLESRRDTVLVGSFLWSEVFRGLRTRDEEMTKFCAWEERLLAAVKPPMICVGDLAMPGLLASTSPVPTGWMSEPAEAESHPQAHAGAVLVQGGAGAAGRLELELACRALLQVDLWPVVVERALAPESSGRRIDAVRGQSVAAGPLVVVCRPGTGTLCECVEAGVPVLALHESDSPEMEHNARRVVELGLGESLPSDFTAEEVVAAVKRLASPESREAVRRRCAEFDRHGLDEAATWLADRLAGAS